jgi:serine/threonine protein kinase
MIGSHLYVLNGIQKLLEKDIIHMDIKENNIMYDDVNDVFLFIDFGMSMQMKDIEPETYEKQAQIPFAVLTDYYPPWCVEILLLAYIARQIKQPQSKSSYVDPKKFNSKPESLEDMKRICKKHITTNSLYNKSITSQEREEYKNKLYKWIDSFVGKTYKNIWSLLVKQCKTWDNYSICALYLRELESAGIVQMISMLNEDIEYMKFITSYIEILKSVLLSSPDKRINGANVSTSIINTFSKIKKPNYHKTLNVLIDKISTPKNIEQMKTDHKEQVLAELNMDEKIKNK